MRNKSILVRIITDPQILSALIWAAVIIACSWISGNSSISSVLITAAGFHVIMMSTIFKRNTTKVSE